MSLATIFYLHFFSLLRLRPPSSTLFPYTTLFRSHDKHRLDRPAIFVHALLLRHIATDLCKKRLQIGRDVAKKEGDRKSTRLNSSHVRISYAVFCLKKKKQLHNIKKCDNCIRTDDG